MLGLFQFDLISVECKAIQKRRNMTLRQNLTCNPLPRERAIQNSRFHIQARRLVPFIPRPVSLSRHLPISPSPNLPISPSPNLPVGPSPSSFPKTPVDSLPPRQTPARARCPPDRADRLQTAGPES